MVSGSWILTQLLLPLRLGNLWAWSKCSLQNQGYWMLQYAYDFNRDWELYCWICCCMPGFVPFVSIATCVDGSISIEVTETPISYSYPIDSGVCENGLLSTTMLMDECLSHVASIGAAPSDNVARRSFILQRFCYSHSAIGVLSLACRHRHWRWYRS